jgi:hypothetical protein
VVAEVDGKVAVAEQEDSYTMQHTRLHQVRIFRLLLERVDMEHGVMHSCKMEKILFSEGSQHLAEVQVVQRQIRDQSYHIRAILVRVGQVEEDLTEPRLGIPLSDREHLDRGMQVVKDLVQIQIVVEVVGVLVESEQMQQQV